MVEKVAKSQKSEKPRKSDKSDRTPVWARERQVEDVATLKALADPMRLAILGALMSAEGGELTAKGIAAALGEPQTKLYRHIRQLEKTGLIAVSGTRLVSGIVESRYVAAQESLRLAPGMFAADSPARAEAYDAVLAGVDRVREDFRSKLLSGRLDLSLPKDGSAGPPSLFSQFELKLTPERVARLRLQLVKVFDELLAEGNSEGPEAVDVTMLTLLYGPQSDPGGATGRPAEAEAAPAESAGLGDAAGPSDPDPVGTER
ncbi:ArsR/SmtB family transcription factor [Kitasatospora sp. NPDC004240]